MSRSRSHSNVGHSLNRGVRPVVNTSPREQSMRHLLGSHSQSKSIILSAWARDESPSPTAERADPFLRHAAGGSSSTAHNHTSSSSLHRGSSSVWDAASTDTNATEKPGNHWWAFARPRRHPLADVPDADDGKPNVTITSAEDGDTPQPTKERSRASSWFIDSVAADRWRSRRRQNTNGSTPASQPSSPDNELQASISPITQRPTYPRLISFRREFGLRLEMPPQQPEPALTVAHTQTPGWESPWAPHQRISSLVNARGLSSLNEDLGRHNGLELPSQIEGEEFLHRSRWFRRRKKFRHFCLHHNYVPLVSSRPVSCRNFPEHASDI